MKFFLTHNSNQHLISPYSNTADKANKVVVRLREMINNEISCSFFNNTKINAKTIGWCAYKFKNVEKKKTIKYIYLYKHLENNEKSRNNNSKSEDKQKNKNKTRIFKPCYLTK